MSKTVHIESPDQFSSLISSSSIVVVDFYADWCGPCKQIAPMYEQLSAQLSRPNKITFTKVNTDKQQELMRAYGVTALPTFMVFKNAQQVQTIKGANPRQLSEVVKKLANEANAVGDSGAGGFGEASSSGRMWLGAGLPKGYTDVTDQVDIRNLELLNFDSEYGTVRSLFEAKSPADLEGKGKDRENSNKDWVKSDTDEQLMLYIPFQSTLKIHSLFLTSLSTEDNENTSTLRPKTIKLFKGRAQILGFDEADDTPATQQIQLSAKDWDPKTGTAKVDLRFVNFQNVTSLVMFVVDGDGEGDETRLDRVRIIGETGEKRDGKIEKVGEDD